MSAATAPDDPTEPAGILDLRDVLESAPDGVAVTDPSGTIRAWNSTAAALTGWSAEEAVGQTLEWLHSLDRGADADADLVLAENQYVRGSAWRRCSDGSRFWCAYSAFAVRAPDGTLTGYFERFRPAAGTKPQPRALPEDDRLVSSSLHRGGIVVFEQDLELRYQWVSASPAPLGVESVGAIIGQTDGEVLPPECRQAANDAKRSVIETGEPATIDLTFTQNGERRAVRISAGPLYDPEAHVVGIRGVASDATDEMRVQERLRDSFLRLAAAESVARMGSWEYDVACDRATWSDGAYEILGRSPGELPDRLAASPDHLHPDDRERRNALVERALETGESFEFDYRIIRGDGRIRSMHARVEVISDDNARPLKLIGTFRDVTEADESARTLHAAAEELARRAVELQEQVRDHGPIHGVVPTKDPRRNLSARQREILALVAQGMNNLEIANQLFLTENTVKWHIGRILKVLGVANRSQAIATYLRSAPTAEPELRR